MKKNILSGIFSPLFYFLVVNLMRYTILAGEYKEETALLHNLMIMVMSASSPTSLAETGSSYEYVKTQALSAVIGLIAMLVISKIDYRIYRRFDKLIYIGVIVLLAAVAVIGKEVGRSKTLDKLRLYEFSTI